MGRYRRVATVASSAINVCRVERREGTGEIENPKLCLLEKLKEPMQECILNLFFFKYE